jgi:hypothetical protein
MPRATRPLPGTPWRDEPPGRISRASLAALKRLTAEDKIYGTWERQRDLAHDLAGTRSEQGGHRIRRVRRRPDGQGHA